MKFAFSFGQEINSCNNEDSCNIDDCDLSDELLSEGAEANIPNSIKNISKNMNISLLSKRRNSKSMLGENEFNDKDETTNKRSNQKKSFNDESINSIDVGVDLIRPHRRTLKEDISNLLRTLAKEKRNKTLKEIKAKSHSWNVKCDSKIPLKSVINDCNSDYVTMKEIQPIVDNQFMS